MPAAQVEWAAPADSVRSEQMYGHQIPSRSRLASVPSRSTQYKVAATLSIASTSWETGPPRFPSTTGSIYARTGDRRSWSRERLTLEGLLAVGSPDSQHPASG